MKKELMRLFDFISEYENIDEDYRYDYVPKGGHVSGDNYIVECRKRALHHNLRKIATNVYLIQQNIKEAQQNINDIEEKIK